MLTMGLLIVLGKRVRPFPHFNCLADKHVTKEVRKCEVDSTNSSNLQRKCMKESGKLAILERWRKLCSHNLTNAEGEILYIC